MSDQEKNLRPFHETIVDAIKGASSQELALIATLLKKTVIPKNHSQIIKAWNEQAKAMCCSDGFEGVVESLQRQKNLHDPPVMKTYSSSDNNCPYCQGSYYDIMTEELCKHCGGTGKQK